ncbi:PucR family transcriptional regulator [Streptomyces chumphonensis]|uniref:PucR family transcriptional regulator n=1 Tax=Streptomyces chumphonensis TaxID=1214925 RepID=UPI003D72349D
MQPTLASLVQHSALKLTVLAGSDRLDAPVRWAQVSELTDPVPYLDGGELLLVTAMKLDAEDPAAMAAYVRRLVAAGVVGLGFAAGVNYEHVPAALVDAARAEDFPLLEVPRRTPFIAITKAVSAAIAAEQYRSVTAGFEAQRELTRAALSAEGPAALLARLATHVGGWAALFDVSGALVAAAPSWAARRAARLTADVERLRDRPAPASAVVSADGDDRVELQSVGGSRRTRAVLAVGTDAPPGTAARYAVNSAVALLTLTTERSRALQAAEQRLGGALVRLLRGGAAGHAHDVAGPLYGALLDGPLRVVLAEDTTGRPGPPTPQAPGALDALAEVVESGAARRGETVLTAADAGRLVVLAADGGAALAACARHARAVGESVLAVGVSPPTVAAEAASAFRQAEQALSVARRRGVPFVEHEEMAAGSVLPLLADDAVRAFAEGALRPLREHDASGRGDLVASLRAWLSRHGQWDAAAADLGVHRHTLRYRMRRVEEILGRSLDDPDARMELWLALKATDTRPG